jgi:hypothetical protein
MGHAQALLRPISFRSIIVIYKTGFVSIMLTKCRNSRLVKTDKKGEKQKSTRIFKNGHFKMSIFHFFKILFIEKRIFYEFYDLSIILPKDYILLQNPGIYVFFVTLVGSPRIKNKSPPGLLFLGYIPGRTARSRLSSSKWGEPIYKYLEITRRYAHPLGHRPPLGSQP